MNLLLLCLRARSRKLVSELVIGCYFYLRKQLYDEVTTNL